jgi:hypothetical protein
MRLNTTARRWLPALACLRLLTLLPVGAAGQTRSEPVRQATRLLDQQGRVWAAVMPGLQLEDGAGQQRFTTQNGLSNDTVTALAQDAAGRIWVGTREGLLVYENAGFREIGYAQGLPSKQITYLYQSPTGPFWVATAAGALRYADRRLQPEPSLRGLAVYQVGESARQWVFITSQGIRYLPKEQPFAWGWLGWAVGGLLVLGGGLWAVRQARGGQHTQLRLAQVEQQALLAQMNPHFIFNSLQSVQNYILKHQADVAHDYLSRFGGLMRLLLEQSRQPLLPVRAEVLLLRSYLELEALRFDGKFTYEVLADDALLAEEIPAMLLHPFVENAVWHGLAHHTGQGHIVVRVVSEGQYLVATVEDNGIGRVRAAGHSGTHAGFPSRGAGLVAERIALLNRRARHRISVEITDLAQPEGTRVVVRIPRQHA